MNEAFEVNRRGARRSAPMPRASVILACFAASLLALPAVAETPPAGATSSDNASGALGLPLRLSLEDALRVFRSRGFDLLIADAAIQAAEGDTKSAGAVPNPTWDLQGSYSFKFPGHMGAAPSPPWGVTAGLGDGNAIEDSLSGKRGLRLRVARAALAAARLQRSDAQRQLEFQVKQQYMVALLARDLLDFSLEIQKSATKTYDLMHVRLQAGQISEADEAKVETAKLEADQAVDSAKNALRVAKLGLAFLLGVRGKVPEFHVDEDLPVYRVPAALAGANLDELLNEARSLRPDLMAQQHQRERADASLRLARRLRFPDLNLNISYQQQAGYTADAAQPPTIAVGVGGVLPLFYFQQGEILHARADLRTQSVLRDKLEAQVNNDVQTAWEQFTTSRKLIERMQGRLLDRAKRARDLVEIQYQKGAASLLEFLDAQRTFIATNQEYYQDLANYWTAIFLLEQAVGTELK
jgi:cobalt-zinc-cadmium efflux system outer membrane protein